LLLHAVGLLCGLAAVSFAALEPGRWQTSLALLVGFVSALAWFGPARFPDPTWLGVAVAAAAILSLARPRWSLVTIACGGAMAGIWVAVLQAQGLPSVLAVALGAVVPTVCAVLAALRPGFSSTAMQEESLLLVVGFALLLAVVPAIAMGWQSAIALKAVPLGTDVSSANAWILTLVLACVVTGGLYSVWKHK